MDMGEPLAHLEAAHQEIHLTEFDPEETASVALSRKDWLIIGFALGWMTFDFPCLAKDSGDLQSRMVEVCVVQQPEWLREEFRGGEV